MRQPKASTPSSRPSRPTPAASAASTTSASASCSSAASSISCPPMPAPTEINEEPQNEFQKVVAAQDASIEAFLALKEELDHMNALGSKVLQRKHVALKPFHRGVVQHLASPAVARPSCQTLDRIEPVSRSRRASLPRREEWVP